MKQNEIETKHPGFSRAFVKPLQQIEPRDVEQLRQYYLALRALYVDCNKVGALRSVFFYDELKNIEYFFEILGQKTNIYA